MRTPGIDVRPLQQITGAAHFNEVFLDDVRIPARERRGRAERRLGPSVTTLANERTLIGGGTTRSVRWRSPASRAVADLFAMIADAYSEYELLGVRLAGERPAARRAASAWWSPVLKLVHTRHITKVADLSMEIVGAAYPESAMSTLTLLV